MKIAIIGAGISGLGAAYLLNGQHDITVFEKNDYIGGHSRTIEVPTGAGSVPVDTGFIVYNRRNYPLLSGLFDHLSVPVEKSDMSFGVSIENGRFEYATQGLNHLLAQRRNLMNPAFLRMLRDILVFNRKARRYLYDARPVTLGEALDELGMGDYFRRYYMLAMGGAIWSCPLEQMLDFPARVFVRFFDNHGLLTLNDQPQWYTVQGGSREYVRRLTAGFGHRIHVNTEVALVLRHDDGVEVIDAAGHSQRFSQVIFACHSDQALRLLGDATEDEREVLGAIRYQSNRVVVHSDTAFMPRNQRAWASWVYLSQQRLDNRPQMSLSYWMNNLQNLATDMPVFVTLNPDTAPDAAKTYDSYDFEHPVFDSDAIVAQGRLQSLQGERRSWYCGAYHRYGFHEDGLMSGVVVAEALGAKLPWQ
jgi:uncharacterized protein